MKILFSLFEFSDVDRPRPLNSMIKQRCKPSPRTPKTIPLNAIRSKFRFDTFRRRNDTEQLAIKPVDAGARWFVREDGARRDAIPRRFHELRNALKGQRPPCASKWNPLERDRARLRLRACTRHGGVRARPSAYKYTRVKRVNDRASMAGRLEYLIKRPRVSRAPRLASRLEKPRGELVPRRLASFLLRGPPTPLNSD